MFLRKPVLVVGMLAVVAAPVAVVLMAVGMLVVAVVSVALLVAYLAYSWKPLMTICTNEVIVVTFHFCHCVSQMQARRGIAVVRSGWV